MTRKISMPAFLSALSAVCLYVFPSVSKDIANYWSLHIRTYYVYYASC